MHGARAIGRTSSAPSRLVHWRGTLGSNFNLPENRPLFLLRRPRWSAPPTATSEKNIGYGDANPERDVPSTKP
jgi:hypothetical protein